MKRKVALFTSGLIFVILFSLPVSAATDCGYFSASVIVGKPYTSISSAAKEVTIYWEGVNVTINGNGQLVKNSVNSAVKYNYDSKNKRYSSLFFNGHKASLTYANNGSIYSISRSSANTIVFNYNQYGYLTSISYRGNTMRFYYNNDGSLRQISQPVPVQCVYATFDGTL